MVKRIFDIICSACALIILGPLLIFIALVIRYKDGGPVFYRGVRIGRHAKPFRIFKFRTMVVEAEKIGACSTSSGDRRITRIGRSLRKYKLDELPQLFNVFTGRMSLVGPRPEVKYFTDMYTGEEKAILDLRPGITDWATIWNSDEGSVLAGAEDPDRDYLELIRPKKLKLQLKYARQHCFTVDLKIILLTLAAIVKPESRAVKEIHRGDAETQRKMSR